MAIVFPAGAAPGGQVFRFEHHVHDFGERATVFRTKAMDRVEVDETREQRRKVVDEGRVGNAEMGEESVLGQPREQSPQRVFGGWFPHDLVPRKSPDGTGSGDGPFVFWHRHL